MANMTEQMCRIS